MFLVDTSVWIDYLNDRSKVHVEFLEDLLTPPARVVITPSVYQEILQGTPNKKQFRQYQSYFSTLKFVHPANPISSYEAAAKLYFDCRRKGLTVRSTTDCLIAQITIENDLTLLHNDSDFIAIAQIAKKFRQTNAAKSTHQLR